MTISSQSFNRDNFERKKTIGILFVIITRYLVKIVDLLYYESFNWYFLKLLPVCVFQTVHAKRNSAIFHSNFICSFVLVSKRSLISQMNGISRSICDVSITVDRSQRAVYSQYSTSCRHAVMSFYILWFNLSIWASKLQAFSLWAHSLTTCMNEFLCSCQLFSSIVRGPTSSPRASFSSFTAFFYPQRHRQHHRDPPSNPI